MATNKKQRQKSKRDAKKKETRKRNSVSPIKRLADAPGELECWMTDLFETERQLQVFVYKQAGGVSGVACFLVDRGVVGLKDAFWKMNVGRSEFKEMVDAAQSQSIRMKRVSADEVRQVVAGGARWARQNGMKLPADWIKTASLLGGVGDIDQAGVSKFVMEFVGHPEDLRQRLIGESFETYLKRPDVVFVFSANATFMDQKAGRYLNDGASSEQGSGQTHDDFDEEPDITDEELNVLLGQFRPPAEAMAAESTKWANANGKVPSPELRDAWQSILISIGLSRVSMPDATEKEREDFGTDMMESLKARIKDSHVAEYESAVLQAVEHLRADPGMLQRAMKSLPKPGGH